MLINTYLYTIVFNYYPTLAMVYVYIKNAPKIIVFRKRAKVVMFIETI